MASFVAASCTSALAEWPRKKVSSVFVLNQRRGGSLFVCELAIFSLKHPILDQFYMVGCQRDASASISIERLLEAAKDDASFGTFVDSQPMSFCDVVVYDSNVAFFHSKMEEVWHEQARKLLHVLNPSLCTPAWSGTKRTSPKSGRKTSKSLSTYPADADDFFSAGAFDRQVTAGSVTSFALSEWTAVSDDAPQKEYIDKATQTEAKSLEFAHPLTGSPGAALQRKRPDSAPLDRKRPEIDASDSSSEPKTKNPRPPAMPSRFDGVWGALPDATGRLPEPWLLQLHIRGHQVTDGVGFLIKLSQDKEGNFLMENGRLSIEHDMLHRDGKSGRRVSFKRVQRPKQSGAPPRVSFGPS
jgi:hypothetical protein